VNSIPPFTFECAAWDPRKETQEEANARIASAAASEIGAYLKRVEATITTEWQWKETPEKRSGLHFDWLVRWQVQRWSKPRIAAAYRVGAEKRKRDKSTGAFRTVHTGVSAVRNALEKTAQLVGIRLREGKPGRPAGD
jgi:hypothetical protein